MQTQRRHRALMRNRHRVRHRENPPRTKTTLQPPTLAESGCRITQWAVKQRPPMPRMRHLSPLSRAHRHREPRRRLHLRQRHGLKQRQYLAREYLRVRLLVAPIPLDFLTASPRIGLAELAPCPVAPIGSRPSARTWQARLTGRRKPCRVVPAFVGQAVVAERRPALGNGPPQFRRSRSGCARGRCAFGLRRTASRPALRLAWSAASVASIATSRLTEQRCDMSRRPVQCRAPMGVVSASVCVRGASTRQTPFLVSTKSLARRCASPAGPAHRRPLGGAPLPSGRALVSRGLSDRREIRPSRIEPAGQTGEASLCL